MGKAQALNIALFGLANPNRNLSRFVSPGEHSQRVFNPLIFAISINIQRVAHTDASEQQSELSLQP